MKKLVMTTMALSVFCGYSHAEHLQPRNASNLTVGTLPNERVDDSSITQRGSTPLLVDGLSVIRASNTRFADFSTDTLRTDLAAIGVDTGTIRIDLAATGVATGTIRTDLDKKVTLVVGPRGAIGVNTTVENLTQWNIVLASAGLGNPFSSTATATIYFTSGSYPLSGSTWPAGLTAIFDSTAVIVQNGAANSQLACVYGHLVNPNFDFSNKAFTVPQVFVGSNAWIENPTTYGGGNAPSGPTALKWASQFFIGVDDSSKLIVNAKITGITAKDARAVGGVVSYGDAAAFATHRTSSCYVSFKELNASKEAAATHTMFGVFKSTNLVIDVGKWRGLGSNGIIINDGSVGTRIQNFEMEIVRSGWDVGIIGFQDSGVTLDVGTATHIMNGRFIVSDNSPGGASTLIGTAPSTQFVHALNIINVTATATNPEADITFITLSAKSKNAVILNSISSNIGTGLSDSGIGTVKTGLYKDGVAQ